MRPQSAPAASAAHNGNKSGYEPQPPKLAYINESLRQSRLPSAGASRKSRPGTAGTVATSIAASQRSGSAARPGTAGSSAESKRRRANIHNTTFLRDNETAATSLGGGATSGGGGGSSGGTLLPQPLPNGIPYVACYTSYQDLISRNILKQEAKAQVHLSTEDVRLIYEEKCIDQNLKPTWEREMRFLEVISSCCRGNAFSLVEHGLGPRCATAVSQVLARNTFYSLVDLSGNRLRDEGGKALALLLQNNDSIVHLSLRSNDMGAPGIEAIAAALMSNSTLTSLDLGGISGVNRNHVGARGAEALGHMLSANQVLYSLDISSNGLGLEGIGLIARGMHENDSVLKLNLSSNNIGQDGCRVLVSMLLTSRLEVLDLRRNGVGDKGVTYIAKALDPTCPTEDGGMSQGADNIKELLLDQNGIREAGARSLEKMIRSNQSLQVLRLSNNEIGPAIPILTDSLKDNRRLRELALNNCGLGESEGIALAVALRRDGCHLSTLELAKNRVGDGGAAAIASALEDNSQLTKINLSCNAIGNVGGEAFRRLLEINRTLQDISLKQNLIGGTIGDGIHEQLRTNHVVQRLDLNFNDISYEASIGIQSCLAKNNQMYALEETPRLEKKIEKLVAAETDLFDVEEQIETEKRLISDLGGDLLRKKETIRGQTEINRRDTQELEEQLEVAKSVRERANEERMQQDAVIAAQKQKMESRVRRLEDQADRERDRREQALKQIEKAKKKLVEDERQEEEALLPLRKAFKHVDEERNQELSYAQMQAEKITGIELKIKFLQKALGMKSVESNLAMNAAISGGGGNPAASTTGGRGGSAKTTPRRPASGTRRR